MQRKVWLWIRVRGTRGEGGGGETQREREKRLSSFLVQGESLSSFMGRKREREREKRLSSFLAQGERARCRIRSEIAFALIWGEIGTLTCRPLPLPSAIQSIQRPKKQMYFLLGVFFVVLSLSSSSFALAIAPGEYSAKERGASRLLQDLSPELQHSVLHWLPSWDVANLRATSTYWKREIDSDPLLPFTQEWVQYLYNDEPWGSHQVRFLSRHLDVVRITQKPFHIQCIPDDPIDALLLDFDQALGKHPHYRSVQKYHLACPADLLDPDLLASLDAIGELVLYKATSLHFSQIHFPKNLDSLDLSTNEITSLQGIRFPENLRALDLSYCWLTSLADVQWPPGLQVLRLHNNRLSSITHVSFPPSLQRLELARNNIATVASFEGVSFPVLLQELEIGHNGIRSLTGAALPENLQVLSLAFNPIVTFSGISLPQNLQKLCLAGLSLTTLRDIQLPPRLRELNANVNSFRSISAEELPPTLKKLSLRFNQLRSLTSFNFPRGLEELNLSENRIQLIRDEELPIGLKRLSLRSNGIQSLDMIKLPLQLEKVEFSSNQIKTLGSFAIPASLTKMGLFGNPILFLSGANFSSNPFTISHPDELSLVRNMQTIDSLGSFREGSRGWGVGGFLRLTRNL